MAQGLPRLHVVSFRRNRKGLAETGLPRAPIHRTIAAVVRVCVEVPSTDAEELRCRMLMDDSKRSFGRFYPKSACYVKTKESSSEIRNK